MFRLFGRRVRGNEFRVRSRSETAHSSRPANVRIDFLAPQPDALIASLAYFRLAAFQYLTGVLPLVDDPARRAHVAELSQDLLERHTQLRRVSDADESESFHGEHIHQAESDELWRRLQPALWQEGVLAAYLIDGIVVDFARLLGRGLRQRSGIRPAFDERPEALHALAVLRAEIDDLPWLSDRLAVWGRRVVGDTLLWCRSLMVLPEPVLRALRDTTLHREDDVQQVVAQIEAVHADLIAQHTARMEALGLTA